MKIKATSQLFYLSYAFTYIQKFKILYMTNVPFCSQDFKQAWSQSNIFLSLAPEWSSFLFLWYKHGYQTSANRGHDSTFVDEASSTRLSTKPSSSRVIKLMDQNRETRPRGKSQVKSTLIISHLMSY